MKRDRFDEVVDLAIVGVLVGVFVLIGFIAVHTYAVWIVAR